MKKILNLIVLSLLLGLSQRLTLGLGTGAGGGDLRHLPGKFYVTSVTGKVQCVTDDPYYEASDRIFELKKGDSFPARGMMLTTSKGSNVTLVFSNETTFFVDENTRLKVARFEQQPFEPNNNLIIEPSNSDTLITVDTGRVVINTPQLQSGSKMVFETAQARVSILNTQSGGEQGVIEVTERQTHFALVSGAATVQPRAADGEFVEIGKRIKSSQQAFVRQTLTGKLEVSESAEVTADSTAPTAPAGPGSPQAPAAASPGTISSAAPVVITPGMAVVLRVTGAATAQLSDQAQPVPLTVGARLPQGAIVTTGAKGEVYLQPFDGAVATVRPNSQVVLEKLSLAMANGAIQKQTALLEVKAGTVLSNIDPAKRKINNYAVRTPKGIATAQGTSFSVSVIGDDFSVAATADTVSFVTPDGTSYAITAGNIVITPAGGQPQPPVPLAQAVQANPAVGLTLQAAVNTVAAIVQNNIGNLPSASAVNLLSQVIGVATVALPADATGFSAEAVAAVNAPGASTAGNAASATASVTAASVAAAPTQASQIASADTLVAPAQANTVAAAAANAAPAQAGGIATSVMQAIQQGAGPTTLAATTQTAASLAAAIAASDPAQSGAVAGALMQLITQANPAAGTAAITGAGATLASAISAVEPAQAAPVAAAVMAMIVNDGDPTQNTAAAMAQTAASLGAAVTLTVPGQAVPVATALMQFMTQNSGATASAGAAGLLAAAIGQADSGSETAIDAAIALASNQSAASVADGAQQAMAQATQTVQGAAEAVQNGALADQSAAQSTAAVASASAAAAADVIATATNAGPSPNVVQATSVVVTTLNPGQLAAISNDIATNQNAQSEVSFSSSETGNQITVTPNVPTNLPVTNVVSPAAL